MSGSTRAPARSADFNQRRELTYVRTAVTPQMTSIPDFGVAICIGLFIIILIIFFFMWMFFKFIIYFLPSIIVALVVYLVTDYNLGITLVAFVLSAILFAAWGYNRRRR